MIVPNILPILFGCFILPIDVDRVKNIKGTTITSSIFKNKSPSGLTIAAFSLNISPIIVPRIILPIKIKYDL